MKRNTIIAVVCLLALLAFVAQPLMTIFTHGYNDAADAEVDVCPVSFDADSAYAFCASQCEFGPRVMNSDAHDKCGEWIKAQFAAYGCSVESQVADLKGYDGTVLKSENIIARINPDADCRIMFCAHWDSRPWADNDPDENNHHTPIMAANDGASGVAVMLEMARAITSITADDEASLALRNMGIDFICFDAEDWGTPQWSGEDSDADSWALGAQHWAEKYAVREPDNKFYRYAILLDMVGGRDARFYQEQYSLYFASDIVDRVWAAASQAGYGSYFPTEQGGGVTDDHVPVNKVARVTCIDIIPYYPNCQESSFGPTWHTVNDTMENIDKGTLKAVGQTMLQMLWNSK